MTAEDGAGQETGDLRKATDRADDPATTDETGVPRPGTDPTSGAPGEAGPAGASEPPAADLAADERTRRETEPGAGRADATDGEPPAADAAATSGRRRRPVLAAIATTLACLLVLFALIAPEDPNELSVWDFVRIPVEALVGAAVLIVLPARARRITAAVVGVLLGLVTIMKLFDMGFYVSLARPFDPIFDWAFLSPGVNFVESIVGKAGAVAAVILAVLVAVALVVFVTLSVMRLSRIAAGHRGRTLRVVGAFAVVWLVFAVFDVQIAPGVSIASDDAATLAYDNAVQIGADLNDSKDFAQEMAVDQFRGTPGNQLLTALRGKTVLLVFVESYGRVAQQDPGISPGVNAVLDSGMAELSAAGFDARSAFLTSPTTGGGSWLPHSSIESGLWIDNAKRYSTFTSSNRFTLSDAFAKAGWRTVGDIPENHQDWPEGDVYHFQKIYDARNVGYRGPNFSYSDIPDQYTLSYFQRTELADPNHPPLFAEIDLTSSHTPWTPIPRFVPWNQVGNGSIYDPMPREGKQVSEVWPDTAKIHQAYGESIQYTLNTLVSFLLTYGDKNTVMIFVGDHQPSPAIVGDHASRDAPMAIVAKDPAVMDRIASWGWQEGLRPGPNTPVWRMSDFRDRFLAAFGSVSH
ncbi:MAG TPA: sulfatase [Pseudonocardiaceae bacterium]|nr:sulfatase [Pseudonocardiaceae bacterium]